MPRSNLPFDRPIKLVSVTGTLLGTVTIPSAWVAALNRPRNSWQFYVPKAPKLYSELENQAPLLVSVGTLGRYYSYDMYEECLQLWGISLEEFETVPGCSFAPGAGYLRSLVE